MITPKFFRWSKCKKNAPKKLEFSKKSYSWFSTNIFGWFFWENFTVNTEWDLLKTASMAILCKIYTRRCVHSSLEIYKIPIWPWRFCEHVLKINFNSWKSQNFFSIRDMHFYNSEKQVWASIKVCGPNQTDDIMSFGIGQRTLGLSGPVPEPSFDLDEPDIRTKQYCKIEGYFMRNMKTFIKRVGNSASPDITLDAVFYRTYPLLYHKFGSMIIFRSKNLYSLSSPGN